MPLLDSESYAVTLADKARFAQELKLGLLRPSSPLLQKVSAEIAQEAITSPEIQAVIEQLFVTARGQRDGKYANKRKGRGMVGLAAPQIGKLLRIIIVDTQVASSRKTFGTLECFINPQIIWRTRETAEGREGCFSAGPVWGIVRRPIAVKMQAFTPTGARTERIFEGFTARIIQHEIDHLQGIRFPDRITSDKKRHWVHVEELEDYIKLYKKWPRLCSLERWQSYTQKQPEKL